MALAMEQCNVACMPAGYTFVPVVFVPPQKMMAAGQWSCQMTPTGTMTPTCHQPDHFSNASTAVPSGAQSPLYCEDNIDDDEEGDADEACAELSAQIEAGGVARQAAIEALIGSVEELAFDAAACRVVQKALEFGEEEEIVALCSELQCRVREAIHSPHANHVAQKMVEVLPSSSLGFVVEEIIGAGAEFARHRFGCRVFTRLVQRHSESSIARMDELIEELLLVASDLARHAYGHHVIEVVLQKGTTHQRHSVCSTLSLDLMCNAKNRNASYVVETALNSCEDEVRHELLQQLIGTPESLVSLVENQFGCYVAKALLKFQGETFHKMVSQIEAASSELQKSKYGRRLMQELNRTRAC